MRKNAERLIFLAAATTVCIVWAGSTAAFAQTPYKKAEMAAAKRWAAVVGARTDAEKASTSAHPAAKSSGPAFSFIYDSRPSAELLRQWKPAENSRTLQDGRVELTKTYKDPATGLEVRAETTVFPDFPAVEWVLHFKNAGKSDSPILEKILPLDSALPFVGGSTPPVIHYAKGALCSIDDFAPVDKTLETGAKLNLQPGGGRSSSEVLPFFNVDMGGEGMILAVGWSGEWAASFSREGR